MWFQQTPGCNGEHDWDRVLLLFLLLLPHRPVACKYESCLLRFVTLALSSPNSVICGVAIMAMDGEITSIMLSAISANSSRLLPLAVDARIIYMLLGSR